MEVLILTLVVDDMSINSYTDGDARGERPEVELPVPTLVVSYSPPTLPLL